MTAIKLFVDDERNPPDHSWTLAKTGAEALRYFRDSSKPIKLLSFDWYMGRGMNGIQIIREMLIRVELLGLTCLDNTRVISLHSSDLGMAITQQTMLEEAQKRRLLSPSTQIKIDHRYRRG
jgi:hypothetical protein